MSPARFRRIMIAGIAGICTAAGPLALPALATADPALVLGATSVRAGVPFTVTSATPCPSDGGEQTVEFSFTDGDDDVTDLGSVATDEDGAWSTSLTLPVAGPDEDNAWQDSPVARGAGSLEASCTAPAADDFSVPSDLDDDEPGDEDGDDSGDDNGDEAEITQSYAAATVTVRPAAQFSVAPAVVAPGAVVTATQGEACAGTATRVHVGVVELGEQGKDGDDDGDEELASDSTDAYGAVAGGAWAPVALTLPSDTVTGDYAVTVDCLRGDVLLASYDAEPLAVGTITVGTPVCTSRGAAVRVAGTYEESVTVHGRRDASTTIPHTFRFAGDGPWTLSLHSTTTDLRVVHQAVTCPRPPYDLTVSRPGLSDGNRPQARVCNSGSRPVEAVLQLNRGSGFRAVDDEQLDAGECAWLAGSRLGRGDDARARVLLDAPGRSADEVAATFSVHRGRR